ncbi:MAG: hypothetical protein QXT37_10115 [Thermofilaceae archaeon]
MRIEKLATAAAAVTVDELLTYMKETGKLTGPAAYAQDAYRIAGCFGALAYEALMARTEFERSLAEGLALSLLSPAVKSIIGIIKGVKLYSPPRIIVTSAPVAAPTPVAPASRLTGW